MAEFEELRIIGSPKGFAVYNSGRRKLSVMALDLFVRPGQPPLMQIAMPAGNIDVVGKALFAIVDVATGKPRVVRKIEWADGQSTEFPDPEKVQAVVNPNANEQDGAQVPAPEAGSERPTEKQLRAGDVIPE